MVKLLNDGQDQALIHLKTSSLQINYRYAIDKARVVQTKYGPRVLLLMNEGEYWLPNTYAQRLTAGRQAGDVIEMGGMGMTLTGFNGLIPSLEFDVDANTVKVN